MPRPTKPRRASLGAMRLEGIHHVTAITGDAPGNVDFYARVLGLRLVKKSVNQDDPTVYHLFYADEKGEPGSDITFFEYRNARPGRAGAGMVHRVVWRVASEDSLAFWAERLGGEGVAVERARRVARVRGSRGPRARAGRRGDLRRAADRGSPGGPPRARAPGLRGGSRVRVRSRAEPRLPRGGALVLAARLGRVGGARRAARRALRLRPHRGARRRRRGHGPSRRLGLADGRPRGLALARRRRRAPPPRR